MLQNRGDLGRLDAQLFGKLAAGRLLVRLAGRHHAPDHHVIHPREEVLGRCPAMDVDVAGGVLDEDRHAPMEQVPGPDLAAQGGPDYFVPLVHEYADLLIGRALILSRAPSGSTRFLPDLDYLRDTPTD
jgi:hypothetical protein